jgi:hypothetical protein
MIGRCTEADDVGVQKLGAEVDSDLILNDDNAEATSGGTRRNMAEPGSCVKAETEDGETAAIEAMETDPSTTSVLVEASTEDSVARLETEHGTVAFEDTVAAAVVVEETVTAGTKLIEAEVAALDVMSGERRRL